MPEEFGKDTDLLNEVSDEVKNLAPLRQITFDTIALKAVRQNNKEVVALDEDEPNKGGNVEAYNKIQSSGTTIG